MYRRDSKKLFVVCIAFGIAFGLNAQQAFATQSEWRALSRHARSLVDDNDYQGAVSYYSQAIKKLQSKDPKSEYQYDLILNLAESYLLMRAFARAKQLLDSVEEEMTARTFFPTLFCRCAFGEESQNSITCKETSQELQKSMRSHSTYWFSFIDGRSITVKASQVRTQPPYLPRWCSCVEGKHFPNCIAGSPFSLIQ